MRKILGNKKGISTILAALLMVVIVVVASVMVYAWSTGLLGGLLVNPQVGNEAMNLETYSFTGTETVNLNIRNTGTAAITLITYYVKDTAGNQYSRTTWTGPSGAPNTLLAPNPATVTIGTACATCTYAGTGTGFAFVSGNSYTVTVITSRNAQFNFQVIR